jgi:hypothetical protein
MSRRDCSRFCAYPKVIKEEGDEIDDDGEIRLGNSVGQILFE